MAGQNWLPCMPPRTSGFFGVPQFRIRNSEFRTSQPAAKMNGPKIPGRGGRAADCTGLEKQDRVCRKWQELPSFMRPNALPAVHIKPSFTVKKSSVLVSLTPALAAGQSFAHFRGSL